MTQALNKDLEKRWLIVTDLDGTLLGQKGELSPYSTEVVRRLWHSGNVVALASGRTWELITPIRDILGVPCPIIACNGALIGERSPGEFVSQGLAAEVTLYVATLLKESDVSISACTSEGNKYFSSNTVDYRGQPGEYLHVRQLTTLCDVEEVYKLSIALQGNQSVTEFLHCLNHNLVGRAHVTVANEETVDVTGVSVTKAMGLGVLRDKYRICAGHTVAFGNQMNDIEMLKAADIGVAVDDAVNSLKNIADEICRNSGDDGVASWLDGFFELKVY